MHQKCGLHPIKIQQPISVDILGEQISCNLFCCGLRFDQGDQFLVGGTVEGLNLHTLTVVLLEVLDGDHSITVEEIAYLGRLILRNTSLLNK